jgi:hypothetical protein
MNTIRVVITRILAKKSSQMSFIQRDDVVQHFSTATSNPPFRSSVLPRRLDARLLRLETGCREQSNYIDIKLRVMVEDDVAVWIRLRERLPQLLDNPFRCGMSGNVAVQNLAPAMFDDKEAVQQLERQRGYREEIERNDHLATIGEKCLPLLIRLPGSGPQASEIPGDRAFGDVKAEL